MLNYVSKRCQYIINNAIKVWYMGEKIIEYKQEDLDDLKQLLINDIRD